MWPYILSNNPARDEWKREGEKEREIVRKRERERREREGEIEEEREREREMTLNYNKIIALSTSTLLSQSGWRDDLNNLRAQLYLSLITEVQHRRKKQLSKEETSKSSVDEDGGNICK